ncbi:hypothetical protein FH972_012730 [Carpinus fangiana]|uniref:Uncharacterized protein n=1 Tax=Carpinus fangiana TaxID=176857 RepID=A0A5N6R5M0_9ROSI|nr:hypothetical protein FH972_012730 [Carpinus fangiana]
MIERAIEAEREQHKQQMDEILAQQSEEITVMITTQVAAQMVAYEAQIHVLEGSKHVSSESEVTNVRASHYVGSLARVIVRSSADSRSNDVSVEANDDHNEAQQWTLAGQKSHLSK